MPLKVLGVGLSKTGTVSLHRALQILGFKAIHFDRDRLQGVLRGTETSPSFRIYDDVDAVTDLPAAVFYSELLEAYPDCKAVLTLRDPEAWWRSIERHFEGTDRILKPTLLDRARALVSTGMARRLRRRQFMVDNRNFAYGSVVAKEYLFKKRFAEHNERVQSTVPSDRLLVMDITAGDGWEKLCPFLEVPIRDAPFPAENRSAELPTRRSAPQ